MHRTVSEAAPRSSRVANVVASGAVANIAAMLISAANTWLSTRLMSLDNRGVFVAIYASGTAAVVAFGLSIDTRGIFHLASSPTERGETTARLLAISGAAWLGCFATTSVLAVFEGRQYLSIITAVLFAAVNSLQVLIGVPLAHLRFKGKHHRASWLPVAPVLTAQVAGIGAMLLRPTAGAVLIGMSVGAAIPVAVCLATLWYHNGGSRSAVASNALALRDFGRTRWIFADLIRTHPGALLHALHLRLPLITMALVTTPAAVSIYGVAVAIAEVGLVVSQGALAWVLAAAARDPSDFSTLRRAVRLTTVLTGLLLITSIIVVALTSSRVFGAGYSSVGRVVAVLSPAILIISAWRLLTYDLVIRGAAWPRTASSLVGVVVVVPLTVVLAHRFAEVGVALAMDASTVALALVVLVTARATLRRRTPLSC